MKYPKHIYVYVYDYDKEVPILAIAESLDELPEDQHNKLIATYSLNQTAKLRVAKTLLGR